MKEHIYLHGLARRLLRVFALSAMVIAMAPASAAAQYLPASSGSAPHEGSQNYMSEHHPEGMNHDSGFLFRFQLGAGGLSTRNSDFDMTVSGMGVALQLAIGGIIRPNLALHGTMSLVSAFDPNIEMGGMEAQFINYDFNSSLIGVGLTHFFPMNFYISGSLGLALLSMSDKNSGAESRSGRGWGIELSSGKEWWLAPRFGLGASLGAGYHSVPESVGRFGGATFALSLSGTVN